MPDFVRFFVRRLLLLVPLVIAMAVLIFFLMRLIPGCPAEVQIGIDATPEQVEVLRQEMRLDEPIHVQLFEWLSNLARGNLGYSYYQGRSINEIIMVYLPPTLKLTFFSFVLSVIVGTVFGILSAVKQHSFTDRSLVVFATSGVAIPHFWFGLLLMLLFGVLLGWLPTSGYQTFAVGGFGSLRFLVLPVTALAMGQIAALTRMTRARMLDVLHQDFVLTARSKGLSPAAVIFKHAFKNILVTNITVMSMILAILIGGSVIIENVFAIPGMGRLLITSIVRRDYLVVQSAILVITAAYMVLNFIADILYSLVDPRISY